MGNQCRIERFGRLDNAHDLILMINNYADAILHPAELYQFDASLRNPFVPNQAPCNISPEVVRPGGAKVKHKPALVTHFLADYPQSR
jgi:hypothetical protein